jgi:phage terminase large subunit
MEELRTKVTPVFAKTQEAKAKTLVNVGGAGSSKSYSIAQLLISKLINEQNKRIGICRKTFPALRMTAMLLVLRLLKDYGIYEFDKHNKSANTYEYNTNVIQFFSLDDPEKIKSADFNYIWMEEANEFTYEDYTVLKLRLRHPTQEDEPNQMFLSLNPIDENNWIAQKLIKEEGVQLIKSTYKDNPFLPRDYIQTLENLINEDENYYRVYALGEWGRLENLVYRNYKIVDMMPQEWEAMAYGLDFGYVNPSALVKVCLIKRDVYIEEIFYKPGMTNSDIIERLSHEGKGDIYADPTQLQMIEEIRRAGHNIYPANKDVKLGIDLCKRQVLNITKSSANLIKEIGGYQYKKDKDGRVLEDPVKFNDHALDAMRYCVFGLVDRFGFATATPGGNKPRTAYRR